MQTINRLVFLAIGLLGPAGPAGACMDAAPTLGRVLNDSSKQLRSLESGSALPRCWLAELPWCSWCESIRIRKRDTMRRPFQSVP